MLYAAVIYVSHQPSLTQRSISGPLEEASGGKTLQSDEDVEQMVHRRQRKEVKTNQR